MSDQPKGVEIEIKKQSRSEKITLQRDLIGVPRGTFTTSTQGEGVLFLGIMVWLWFLFFG